MKQLKAKKIDFQTPTETSLTFSQEFLPLDIQSVTIHVTDSHWEASLLEGEPLPCVIAAVSQGIFRGYFKWKLTP